MHDGDQKAVTFNRLSVSDATSITIKPYDNDQKWVVHAPFDAAFQNASIDFSVPGKPGPPPVNLTLTYKKLFGADRVTTMCEFTDPTGTLAVSTLPLNAWISATVDAPAPEPFSCPYSLNAT